MYFDHRFYLTFKTKVLPDHVIFFSRFAHGYKVLNDGIIINDSFPVYCIFWQMRMSMEAKRILNKRPELRTEQEIQYVSITETGIFCRLKKPGALQLAMMVDRGRAKSYNVWINNIV